jgi:hypothetical protein
MAAMARTGWAKLRGYRVVAAGAEQDARLDQCFKCEELNGYAQCRICTCFVQAKTFLTMESCPKQKWKRIWAKKKFTEGPKS